MKTFLSLSALLVTTLAFGQSPLTGAETLLPLAVEVAQTNPAFSTMVSSSTTFDLENAVAVHRVEASKIATARSLNNAVEDSGEFYIPMCQGSQCPLLATISKSSGSFQLISVGMEQTAKDLAEARLTNAKVSVVVEYSEPHVLFTLAGETLRPLSAEHAQRVTKLLAASGVNAPSGEASGLDVLRRVSAQMTSLRQ